MNSCKGGINLNPFIQGSNCNLNPIGIEEIVNGSTKLGLLVSAMPQPPYSMERPGTHYTGHFIMFSIITNIYNKKTKGPTLMEFFTATGKLKKFFFDN